MNLLTVFSEGDLFLQAIFLLLVLMSLLSWYVIFMKYMVLLCNQKKMSQFEKQYYPLNPQSDLPLLSQQKGLPSQIVQSFLKAKQALPLYAAAKQNEVIDTFLSQQLDIIKLRLDKGMIILASIGSSAPFVGLLGTVWGVHNALLKIAEAGTAELHIVAGPMGEALVATAIGLFAAIPALFAYNFFAKKTRVQMQSLRHLAEQIKLV